MKNKYIVVTKEVHAFHYEVEADSLEEAKNIVQYTCEDEVLETRWSSDDPYLYSLEREDWDGWEVSSFDHPNKHDCSSNSSGRLFRPMVDDEEQEFRDYARENYVPHSEINRTWHPHAQDECKRINDEHLNFVKAGIKDQLEKQS